MKIPYSREGEFPTQNCGNCRWFGSRDLPNQLIPGKVMWCEYWDEKTLREKMCGEWDRGDPKKEEKK